MQGADIFRIGAAAAADNAHARMDRLRHGLGKFGRTQVIVTVHRIRQARIRLGDDRQIRVGDDLPQDGQQLLRAQGAVQTDGICAKAGQRGCHGGGSTAGESAARFVKAHRDDDREAAVLFGSDQGGAGLLQVGHGFDGDQVSASLHASSDQLAKHVHRSLKGKGAQGFQQLPQGADVQRDPGGSAHAGLLRGGHSGTHDFLHRHTQLRQLAAVRAKGVGIHDIRAHLNILAVDGRQQLGSVEGQQLRQLAGLKAGGLEHGAHRAVQENQVACIKHGRSYQPFYIRRIG